MKTPEAKPILPLSSSRLSKNRQGKLSPLAVLLSAQTPPLKKHSHSLGPASKALAPLARDAPPLCIFLSLSQDNSL